MGEDTGRWAMKVVIYLDTNTASALHHLADETGASQSEAAVLAVREYLIGIGMLESEHDLDEDTGQYRQRAKGPRQH